MHTYINTHTHIYTHTRAHTLYINYTHAHAHAQRQSIARLMVVSHKLGQEEAAYIHACMPSGLHNHYSELFTWMAALKFKNTQPP